MKCKDITHHYGFIQTPIAKTVLDLIGKNAVFTIRMSRGMGKTNSLANIFKALCENKNGFDILIVSGTIRQARDNFDQYSADIRASNDWRSINNGYQHKITGSTLRFGGFDRIDVREHLRGKHPDIIFQDEAQNVRNFTKWLTVLGNMGRSKGCLFIFAGTGGYSRSNLLTQMELKIKNGTYEGISIKKTLYDVSKEDDCDKWKKEIEKVEKQAQVIEERADGKIVILRDHTQNPDFRREILCEDENDETDGELAFKYFDEENIIQGDYEIDFSRPVFVVMDYGSNDPSVAEFSQIKNGRIEIFAELYTDKSYQNMETFASDLANKLEELGLAEINIQTIEKEVEIGSAIHKKYIERHNIKWIHPQVIMYGDSHGASNWNRYLNLYFEDAIINDVGDAKDGLDLARRFVKEKRIVISEACPRLINDMYHARMDVSDNQMKKKHIPIKDKYTHTIVTVCYLVLAEEIDDFETEREIKSEIIAKKDEIIWSPLTKKRRDIRCF